jgi:hypothetical protein
VGLLSSPKRERESEGGGGGEKGGEHRQEFVCNRYSVFQTFNKSMFIAIISFVIFYNNNNVLCALIISTVILKLNILLIILSEASAYSVSLLPSLLTPVNSHLLLYPLVTHSRANIMQQPQRGMEN